MGTLQTEIQKTMQEWDNPNKPQAEIVFDYVSLHPSCSTNDVVSGTGLNVARASAMLLSLFERGKVGRKAYPNPDKESPHKLVYHYWTEVDQYNEKGVSRKPVKKRGRPRKDVSAPKDITDLLKPAPKERAQVRKDVSSIMAVFEDARREAEMEKLEAERRAYELDIEEFVRKLNVHDAKKIYTALRKIFG